MALCLEIQKGRNKYLEIVLTAVKLIKSIPLEFLLAAVTRGNSFSHALSVIFGLEDL